MKVKRVKHYYDECRFRSVNPDISTKESVRYRGQGHEQANQEEQTDKDIGESNLSDRQKLVEL